MSKRSRLKEHLKTRARHLARVSNLREKYRKIQNQFKERSSKRYEGKRVRVEDVIEELSGEWCLSTARIEAIIRMKLD